jgi:hypothetical protein
LAKEGALLSLDEHSYFNYVPISYFKLKFDNFLWCEWICHAFESDKPLGGSILNSWLRSLLPFNKNNTQSLLGLYKKLINCINYYTVQFFTGHGSFSNYLTKFKLIDDLDNVCQVCGLFNDSPEHTFFNCVPNLNFTKRLRSIGISLNNLDLIFKKLIPSDEKFEEFSSICEELIKLKNLRYREFNSDNDLNPP